MLLAVRSYFVFAAKSSHVFVPLTDDNGQPQQGSRHTSEIKIINPFNHHGFSAPALPSAPPTPCICRLFHSLTSFYRAFQCALKSSAARDNPPLPHHLIR
jgi:hypothetical protein